MQKTAYEMHISDWSSDVGSSDLARALHPLDHASEVPVARNALERRRIVEARNMAVRLAERPPQIRTDAVGAALVDRDKRRISRTRSEEQTSELQSLMRISYAVLCLKKKNNYHK